jgi:hypothetical protein
MKLAALVREHAGGALGADPPAALAPSAPPFGGGAALMVQGTAWVLLDEQPARGLGAALAWASRQAELQAVSIVADASTGVLARRAALFGLPITVWQTQGRGLIAATAEPQPSYTPVDVRHELWRAVIAEAGADPVDEHGVLAGEVRGLEVCRVVTDAYSDEVRLEVGVGAHDRESFMMLHGNKPTMEALSEVVQAVVKHREVGAPLHPLNRLGAERFLRWLVINAPERVGAAGLHPADPAVLRTNLKDPVPCVAVGESLSGEPLVVVCSVGIDLDLVPFAVDARAMHAPAARLVLVVPERDASPVTLRLASLANGQIDVVTWR